MPETKPIVVLGGGGHAAVLIDAIRLLGYRVHGYVAPEPHSASEGLPYLGNDSDLADAYPPSDVVLVNAIGAVRADRKRTEIYETFVQLGYRFARIVHPGSIISTGARLHDGVQVLAGAIIQAEAVVHQNAIINTRASVDHHSVIGSGAHIGPGATICGEVAIGDSAFIGAGATVIQGVCIGRFATIGAGAVVIRDVPDFATAVGVPARGKK